jgi:hypothetical protein
MDIESVRVFVIKIFYTSGAVKRFAVISDHTGGALALVSNWTKNNVGKIVVEQGEPGKEDYIEITIDP